MIDDLRKQNLYTLKSWTAEDRAGWKSWTSRTAECQSTIDLLSNINNQIRIEVHSFPTIRKIMNTGYSNRKRLISHSL